MTRWNSWYDAVTRALKLRTAVDEFIDHELGNYNAALARYAGSRSLTKRPPKQPSLLANLLSADDWSIITQYVALLRPLKLATVLLQGHVNTSAPNEKAVKGAIWQVLPIFDSMMSAFELARERYLPQEMLNNRSSQQVRTQPFAPSLSLTTPSPTPIHTIRRSQSIPVSRISASIDSSTSQNEPVVSEEQTRKLNDALTMSTTESEVHFSTNINLAWQKLDAYHNKTDATPIYRAAVVLNPRLKWRWFDRYWAEKPLWRRAAKEAVAALWEQYK
jgi:hypothetical protein